MTIQMSCRSSAGKRDLSLGLNHVKGLSAVPKEIEMAVDPAI